MIVQTYRVQPVQRDPDVADAIETKLKTVPNFLHGQSFFSLLSTPGSVFFTVDGHREDGNGVIGVKEISQGYFGVACMTFWDRRLEDKVVVCQEAAKMVMACCQLHFLSTAVPLSRARQLGFIRNVGFRPYRQVADHQVSILLMEDL